MTTTQQTGRTRYAAVGSVVTRYVIESRIPGQTGWESEGSGDVYDTETEAEADMATLEPTNDDGARLEYRVVEVQS